MTMPEWLKDLLWLCLMMCVCICSIPFIGYWKSPKKCEVPQTPQRLKVVNASISLTDSITGTIIKDTVTGIEYMIIIGHSEMSVLKMAVN